MVNRVSPRLRPCLVKAGKVDYFGFLFIENDRVVVLLNNLRDRADLGPLKHVRDEHILPEADIFVLPRVSIDAIQLFEVSRV